jgi:hypothetical protein
MPSAAQIPGCQRDEESTCSPTPPSYIGSGASVLDVVLLACTGPVVAALTAQRVFWGPTRPRSGYRSPGDQRAGHTAGCDRRAGVRSVPAAQHARGLPNSLRSGSACATSEVRVGRTALPARRRAATDAAASSSAVTLVFAAQAKVPGDADRPANIVCWRSPMLDPP